MAVLLVTVDIFIITKYVWLAIRSVSNASKKIPAQVVNLAVLLIASNVKMS